MSSSNIRECYDEETYKAVATEGYLFASRYIHFVSTAEDSKRLIQAEHPTVEVQIPHRGNSHEL